jgi:hypothetical protein
MRHAGISSPHHGALHDDRLGDVSDAAAGLTGDGRQLEFGAVAALTIALNDAIVAPTTAGEVTWPAIWVLMLKSCFRPER